MKSFLNYILSSSIYTKLAVVIVFMVFFISGSTVLISLNLSNEQTKKISNELIQSNINTNKEFITTVILEKDYWSIYKYLKALSNSSAIKEIGVIDSKNYILAYSNPKKIRSGTYVNNLESYSTFDIVSNETYLGKIILIENEDNINEIIKKTFINSFYFIIVIALFSLFISNLFLKKIMSRFQIVIDNMKNISNKNWDNIKYEKTYEKDELNNIIVQSVEIVDEIKDLIQKESELRIFYHNVLSSIDSFILICDKQLNIRYHNNHNISTFVLDEAKAFFEEKFYDILIKKENTSFTLEVKENKSLYLFIKINNIGDRLLINISDITKMKEAEENDKVLHSLEMVREVSSQFAHEIKNLLQPLALLLPKNKLPDSEDLPIINMTLSKMKQQVSDYLVIGRAVSLDNNQLTYPISVLNELLDILRPKLEEKRLSIEIDFEENITINLNKKYVELILMNLITNAIEASFRDTKIKISWKYENEKETILVVENIGETIKDTSSIFKPFFTTKKEGSGLGLFSIYKIVYTAQGKIDVTSYNNETIFKIYLPKETK